MVLFLEDTLCILQFTISDHETLGLPLMCCCQGFGRPWALVAALVIVLTNVHGYSDLASDPHGNVPLRIFLSLYVKQS